MTLTPKQFVKLYKPEHVVCCFSGGKDSLAMTHYALTSLKNVDVAKHVIWADTTIMIPPAGEFIRQVCERFGWLLTIVRPKQTFEEYALKWGMPSMFRRWCCWALKVGPINDWVEHLPGRKSVFLGLRRAESVRRKDFPELMFRRVYDKRYMHHPLEYWTFNPIIDWSDQDVENYIRKNSLPVPPWYRQGIRETCQCGAFSSMRELRCLRGNYPEIMERLAKLEEQFRAGGKAFYLRSRPRSPTEFLRQKILEDYFLEG